MNEAIAFLHALAQALSTSTLYTSGHPAIRRSAEQLWQAAARLLAVDSQPVFLFLGTAPVYAGRALHDLRDWQHSGRLAAVGVQRLEFDDTLTLESVVQLVDCLATRLASGRPAGAEPPIAGVRFGDVALQEAADAGDQATGGEVGGEESSLRLDLAEELDAMHFVWTEAARGVVARAEADAIARILAAVIDPRRLPQVNMTTGTDRYHVVHAVNTALLAMTASAAAGLDAAARHRIAVVALLHDIGMALLPAELAHKERLEDARVETHPSIGAALLLRKGGTGLNLAAVVAYEHHMRPDGKGYPERRIGPPPHWASSMVACCATFAALRAPRPFRASWSTDRVVRYINDGAGTVFDAEIGTLVASLVRPA